MVGGCAQGAAAQSELWERAVTLSALSSGYSPRTMVASMEELNGDGSRKSQMETTFALTYDRDGKIRDTTIIRATRDGRDVTAELQESAKKNAQRSKGSGTAFGFDGMLFEPSEQSKIRILAGAAWVTRNGKRAARIPFEIDGGRMGEMNGEVEIDADTGVPLVARLAARVPFVDHLTFRLQWAPLAGGGFVLSTMDFDGTLALLLVKRGFRGSMVFEDYMKLPG